GNRWRIVLTQSPAGSVHSSELAFPQMEDRLPANSGLMLPDGRKIALNGAASTGEVTPDEDRVNRSAKKGRVVAVEMMQPPKAFSAGSVLQRTSMLTPPPAEKEMLTAFARPGKAARQIELASFYFRKEEKTGPAVSPLLAGLVTNDALAVLATAYAPPEPDFALQSPLDAILKMPEAGRFIPLIGHDDQDWAATLLPAGAFSA